MLSGRYPGRITSAIGLMLLVEIVLPVPSKADRPIYLDPSQPVEKRVEDLLSRMSLEEKIGQMNMPCLYLSLIHI